jgi:CheY-like chemotaxis protein
VAFDALVATFAVSARAKGLRLVVQPTMAVVTTDPVMLQSILQNLVSNAISYTKQGEIVIEARETPGNIGIGVRDTGSGIPSDRLDDVFKEFVRLDRSGASENGMGLGLAIVKRQVTELGATIGVRSELGIGSVFTLSLPVVQLTAEPPPDLELQEPVRPSLLGKRILLVDDHPLVLSGLTMEVEAWGARPLPARSVDEAMTLLATMAPDMPDAAIVDLDLGTKVSGLDLLRQIETKYIKLPAVIVTGSTTADTLAMLNESGYRWLTKPTENGALRNALTGAVSASFAKKSDQPAL